MRLIDADALKEADFQDFSNTDVFYVIDNAPTIAAVPAVRCGECRYRELAKVNCKGYTICPASGMEITDDDYCSYGEKMDKGDA